MSTPKQKGNSKTDFELHIDLTQYPYPADYTPKNTPHRTIVLKDDNIYPQIDCIRLIPVIHNLRVRDHKYYFYALSQLERNDIPVHVPMESLRALLQEKYTSEIYKAFDRLCKAGLLFKQPFKRSMYFVNPAYAWKGNRADYLDISTLPLK